MAATAPDHDADVQDQLRAWWKTFLNGAVVDEEEEEDSEGEEMPDNDREEDIVGDEGASAAVTVTASEVDLQRTAAAVLLEKESSGGAALHGDEESPEGGYVQQLQAGRLLGRKRKVVAMRSKPQAIGTDIQDAEGEEIPDVQIRGREPIMTRSKRQATAIEIQDGKGEGNAEDTSVHLQGDLAGRRRRAAIMTRTSKLRAIQEEQRRCCE